MWLVRTLGPVSTWARGCAMATTWKTPNVWQMLAVNENLCKQNINMSTGDDDDDYGENSSLVVAEWNDNEPTRKYQPNATRSPRNRTHSHKIIVNLLKFMFFNLKYFSRTKRTLPRNPHWWRPTRSGLNVFPARFRLFFSLSRADDVFRIERFHVDFFLF